MLWKRSQWGQDKPAYWSSHVQTQDGRVKIQAGLLSEQLRTALKATEGAKILDFSTMAGAFKNHTDPGGCSRLSAVENDESVWEC